MQIFQVDASATRRFSGSPAAVMPMDRFLDDAALQAIAAENNLSETAFLMPEGGDYRLRWFTPIAVRRCPRWYHACCHD
jgi:PhzF family phenazine biosynthesis protein